MSTLILASSSPRRRELLQMLGLQAEVIPSDADETVEKGWTPEHIVESLAQRKAEAVRLQIGQACSGVVIGADTIVVIKGDVLGKPKNSDEAVKMLNMLQGTKHQVFSGVALVRRETGLAGDEPFPEAEKFETAVRIGENGQYRIVSKTAGGHPEMIVGHTVSNVTFRPMSDEEIEAYVRTGEPLDKAGSYGVQGIGSVFIEKIEGDFYSIMGLPLHLLYQMLIRFGINPFQKVQQFESSIRSFNGRG